MGRKWSKIGLLLKAYKESTNPSKDVIVDECIAKLKEVVV